jgi:hypothetical protein
MRRQQITVCLTSWSGPVHDCLRKGLDHAIQSDSRANRSPQNGVVNLYVRLDCIKKLIIKYA